MTTTPYCYGEPKIYDGKDDHHINRVNKDGKDEEDGEDKDNELIEPPNQFTRHHALGFEDVARHVQNAYNDWVLINGNSGLSYNELGLDKN